MGCVQSNDEKSKLAAESVSPEFKPLPSPNKANGDFPVKGPLSSQPTESLPADESDEKADLFDVKLDLKSSEPSEAEAIKEDRKKLEEYQIGEELGRGHFATVHTCVHIPTREEYAVKIINKSELHKNLDKIHEEIEILKAVGRHKNVVSLIDTFQDEHAFYLVMEYCSGGDVFTHIVESGSFSELEAIKVCRELAEALKHIQSKGVVHRDLKPENILLETEKTDSAIKVADFGLSKLLRSDDQVMRTVCGTWAYCAPEVIKRKAYTPLVDNWTLGVLMFTLLAGYHPFDIYGDLPEPKLLRRVVNVQYDFEDSAWDDVSDMAKELIMKLIVDDPLKRMSLDDFLASDWITQHDHTQSMSDPLPRTLDHMASFNQARTKFRTMVYVKLASQKFRNSINGENPLLPAEKKK